MKDFEKNVEKETDSKFREGIYSNAVRAGKRTYFLDVKSTRNDEYYLTITESKKKFDENGKSRFEKHKIFLFQEDFNKFVDGLEDVINYIKKNQPKEELVMEADAIENEKNYTNIDFEDLSKS